MRAGIGEGARVVMMIYGGDMLSADICIVLDLAEDVILASSPS